MYDVAHLTRIGAGWKNAQYFIKRGAYHTTTDVIGWDKLFQNALRIR